MAKAISKIVDLLGGIRPMARTLKRSHSTVQYWHGSGALPRGERDALIRALVAEGQTEAEATELVDRSIAGLSAESEAA